MIRLDTQNLSKVNTRFARLVSAFLLAVAITIVGLVFVKSVAQAQSSSFIPSFWNQQNRLARPDLAGLRTIRFLSEDDFPPFHFALADGTLAGFDIDIARAICDELKVSCTIQARRFDTLVAALTSNQGDAGIAGLRKTPETRAQLDFTNPYYRTPARFAALKANALGDATPQTLAAKIVGVEGQSAHEAYLKAFFPLAKRQAYDSRDALLSALKRGDINIAFDDSIALAFWLNGTDGRDCCRFIGGPYTESRYFGEGIGIALRKDTPVLRAALNYALQKIAEKGAYSELYLKYFPVGFY